jgi:hypothetical protein
VTSYAGDGYSGIYIWGAQLEAGAFATSYIPTVASQVTRAADAASMTGTNFSSWYNQGEGTIFVNQVTSNTTGFKTAVDIGDGTTSNRIFLQSSSANQAYYVNVNATTQVALTSQTYSSNGTLSAAGYKVNDFAYSTSGAAVATDSFGTLPVCSQMIIGNSSNGFTLNGTIKKLAYYSLRISNAQLQALTS